MEVIKHGRKLTEITCPKCGAILMYEDSDIKEEKCGHIFPALQKNLPARKSYGLTTKRYIICPDCNKQIYIDSVAR